MIFLSLIIAALYSYILYRKTKPEIAFRQRAFLFTLRLITVWLVLLFLTMPLYKISREILVKPKAVIMTDNSLSMQLKQAGQEKSVKVNNILNQIRNDLDKNFDTEYYDFASTIKGNPNSTDLLASIENLYAKQGQSPDEIFLLSDGYFSDNNLSRLKDYPFSINTFHVANPQVDLQAKIINLRANRQAYLNEDSPIEITINSHDNSKLRLEISENNQLLKKQNLGTNQDNIIKSSIYLKFDKLGLHNLDIKLLDDNQTYDSTNLVIKVSDNKKKILIITDSPDWDLKFIKDAIKLDNNFSYTYVVAKDRLFWQANEEVSLKDLLADCQLLIINNKSRLIFSSEDGQLIKNKVNNGLGLFLLGDIVLGMEDLYPVASTKIDRNYEAKVIPGFTSKNYTTFSNYFANVTDLPPVKYKYYSLKNTGQEIATLDNMDRSPAIALISFNNAKVLYFTFSDFWRFATRSDRNEFNTLIINIVQWLSSKTGQDFIVSTDKDGYYFGQNVKFSASILDEKGDFIAQKSLKLELLDNEKKSIKNDFFLWERDQYTYEVSNLPAGNYSYKVTDVTSNNQKEGNFIIFDNSLEMSHLDFNNVALREISNLTGGKHFPPQQIEQIKSSLVRERISQDLYSEYKILFNNYFLLLVILSFSIELFLRRRWGLI